MAGIIRSDWTNIVLSWESDGRQTIEAGGETIKRF
jgi:hypothetical protein